MSSPVQLPVITGTLICEQAKSLQGKDLRALGFMELKNIHTLLLSWLPCQGVLNFALLLHVFLFALCSCGFPSEWIHVCGCLLYPFTFA